VGFYAYQAMNLKKSRGAGAVVGTINTIFRAKIEGQKNGN